RPDPHAVLLHLCGPVDQHEELTAAVALPRQHLPRREVDLVGDGRDLVQLLLRAVREERYVLDQVELAIAHSDNARARRGCLQPPRRVRTPARWTSPARSARSAAARAAPRAPASVVLPAPGKPPTTRSRGSNSAMSGV